MDLKELYFVRHGETEWNAIKRMQGQWNSDLNERGRAQAEVNGQLLAKLGIDALIASPLDRTRQTAEIINSHLALPIVYDDRIMEWDCGDWSGYLYEEVQVKWAEDWQALQSDKFNYRGPNCENYPDMIDRVSPFLKELACHPASEVAIVSHGMIGRVMVSLLLGLDNQGMLGFSQPNDVVFKLTLSDDRVDASHFVAGDGPFAGLRVGA